MRFLRGAEVVLLDGSSTFFFLDEVGTTKAGWLIEGISLSPKLLEGNRLFCFSAVAFESATFMLALCRLADKVSSGFTKSLIDDLIFRR